MLSDVITIKQNRVQPNVSVNTRHVTSKTHLCRESVAIIVAQSAVNCWRDSEVIVCRVKNYEVR